MLDELLQTRPAADRNSALIRVRPLGAQDADQLQAFVRDLSAASRYQRFLSPIRELSPTLLDQLTRVDRGSSVALVAVVADGQREVIVGEARYVRDGDGDAEFAIAIADAWHGCGLGRLLMAQLEAMAAAAGVRRLVGDTLRGNRAMVGLALRAGFTIAGGSGPGWVTRLAKELAPAALAA
jgi:acetyltransferase